MNKCPACGFEKVPEGRACPSCGRTDEMATILQAGSPSDLVAPAPTSSTYQRGDIYADRYRIEEFIGRGGMGSVYRVTDTITKQEMALKTLHSAMAQEQDGVDRFKREISILSKIRHPAVPKVFGWGTHGKELYFAAEFVSGNDLKKEVREKGPMAPEEAAKLIADVADALTLTHAMDVVHRDIKPNNIMLTPDRKVKLLDFGIARRTGQAMETITKTGMIVGTPEYMSPEQFGTHRVDDRSDIYSLGVVLFELLTGHTPFSGPSPIVIALKVITEPPPAPRSIRKEIPAWLDRVVMKCMDKDPKKRFTTATELMVELRKPRVGGKARMRWLPTGDAVVEDESEDSQWTLVLSSSKEKLDWTVGMGLRFSDALYELKEIVPPSEKAHRWTYNFAFWPPEGVFRRLVDYEKEAAEKAAAPVKESFLSRVKKLFSRE